MSTAAPPALNEREEARWERVQQGGVWLLDPVRDATLIRQLEWTNQVRHLRLVVAARDRTELGPRVRDILERLRRMP